jgi:hypothetical protein
VVIETDHAVTVIRQVLLTSFVIFRLKSVNIAINLNRQLGLGTVKVNNEVVDNVLSTVTKTTQLLFANSLPQSLFSYSWLFT